MKKYICWNVNSIRSRLPIVKKLINEEKPDVLMLQELKCLNKDFPFDAFPEYTCHVYGQKTYNGVGILLKNYPNVDSVENIDLCNNGDARCIKVVIDDTCIVCIYVPCGASSEEKYKYKVTFLHETKKLLESLIVKHEKLIVAGDFNVALTDMDVQNVEMFKDSVLCTSDVRQMMKEIIDLGLNDFMNKTSDKNPFTWWDYRMPNVGLRIDYILSRNLIGNQEVLSKYRKMNIKEFPINAKMIETKPSDHAPVVFNLS
jgi:exodeoxyribonuclease III